MYINYYSATAIIAFEQLIAFNAIARYILCNHSKWKTEIKKQTEESMDRCVRAFVVLCLCVINIILCMAVFYVYLLFACVYLLCI